MLFFQKVKEWINRLGQLGLLIDSLGTKHKNTVDIACIHAFPMITG